MLSQGKKLFLKVFKEPGKIFITTIAKNNAFNEENDHGEFSNAKSSTIRRWIQAYKWSK